MYVHVHVCNVHVLNMYMYIWHTVHVHVHAFVVISLPYNNLHIVHVYTCMSSIVYRFMIWKFKLMVSNVVYMEQLNTSKSLKNWSWPWCHYTRSIFKTMTMYSVKMIMIINNNVFVYRQVTLIQEVKQIYMLSILVRDITWRRLLPHWGRNYKKILIYTEWKRLELCRLVDYKQVYL